MAKITHAEIRMYRMGTGDCFIVKFFENENVAWKLMIDAGTWSGSKKKLEPYIKDLKTYVDDYVDVLIVTHEHKDHVHAFDACEHLFTDGKFKVGEVWMGWTENDRVGKVKEWKEEYGEKKKALGVAALELEKAMVDPQFKKQFAGNKDADKLLGARRTFSNVLNGFAQLHLPVDAAGKVYKGPLAGMDVVKTKIKKKDTKYFKPGDIISEIAEAEGIKIYVLGPPELYDDVKKEAGGKGDSYEHNKILKESDAFGAAVLQLDNIGDSSIELLPFDEQYAESNKFGYIPGSKEDQLAQAEKKTVAAIKKLYHENDWQKIDFDWLFGAGSFALRMNGLTNNLSLAIAIEFEESGKVMLFPGDAEFGSWSSWHKIDWKTPDEKTQPENKKKKHLTEDLLNRTVFYKVAHHLSHNGTAQKLGLEMMQHKDLVAMATLDYSVINDGWTSTMPNRALIKELMLRTKGRLMIMNEEKLFFDFNEEVPLKQKINEAKSRMTAKERKYFSENFKHQNPLFLQYTITA